MGTPASIQNKQHMTITPQLINVSQGICKLPGIKLIAVDGKGGIMDFQVYHYDNELCIKKGQAYLRLKSQGRINNQLKWTEFQSNGKVDFEYQVGALGWLMLSKFAEH